MYTVLVSVFGLGLCQRINLGHGEGNFVSGSHLDGIELGSVGGGSFGVRPTQSSFRSAPQQSFQSVPTSLPTRVISNSPSSSRPFSPSVNTIPNTISQKRPIIVSNSRPGFSSGSAGLGSVVTGVPTGVAGE